MGLVAAGLLIGIPSVLLTTGLLSPLLYNVKANDVTTLLSATGLLIGVSILASAVPALRASRLDPVVALKND